MKPNTQKNKLDQTNRKKEAIEQIKIAAMILDSYYKLYVEQSKEYIAYSGNYAVFVKKNKVYFKPLKRTDKTQTKLAKNYSLFTLEKVKTELKYYARIKLETIARDLKEAIREKGIYISHPRKTTISEKRLVKQYQIGLHKSTLFFAYLTEGGINDVELILCKVKSSQETYFKKLTDFEIEDLLFIISHTPFYGTARGN